MILRDTNCMWGVVPGTEGGVFNEMIHFILHRVYTYNCLVYMHIRQYVSIQINVYVYICCTAAWVSSMGIFVVQSPTCVRLWPHGLQHARFSCPSPSPEVCSNSRPTSLHRGFPGGASDKEPASAGDIRDVGSTPGLGRLPWRRARQPNPVFLSRESHGQRSLEGYSP